MCSKLYIRLLHKPYVNRVTLTSKIYLSNASSLLSRKYVNKWFKTFRKRYWGSLHVKGLQSYQQSKVEAWQKIMPFCQNRTRRVRPGFESCSVFIILNVRGTVTLEPFDIKISTVPLWKGIDPFVNILSAQEIGSILKTDFTLSKWPHLHRVYLIRV